MGSETFQDHGAVPRGRVRAGGRCGQQRVGAEPEWAGCVAQKHGNFTEEKCATVAEKHGVPDHKGHYELVRPGSHLC